MDPIDEPRTSSQIDANAAASAALPHSEADVTAAAPSDRPAAPADVRPAGPGLGYLLLTGVIALGCGLGGAYLFTRFLSQPRDIKAVSVPGRPAVAGPTEPTGPGTGQAAEPAVAGTAADARAPSRRELNDRLARLKDEVEQVRNNLDKPPKTTAPPEVASLQVRVADLTEATNNLAPLPAKVDHLSNRVSEVSNTLNTVRDELTALQARLGRTSRLASSGPTPRGERPAEAVSDTDHPAPAPEPAPAPTPPENADRKPKDVSLGQGAELFRKGRYKEARDVFNALELSDPDDARVWYYAALSNGFATKDWVDSSARLVEKGIARERAGSPSSAVIDDEFDDLTTATGKDWLAAYRKRVDTAR